MSNDAGMTLRSGRILTMEPVSTALIIEWDGHDYIPNEVFCDFDLEWADVVRDAMTETVDWNTGATHGFVKFLYNTTDHWCQKIWSDGVTDEASIIGQTLVNFVEDAKFVAECWNKYPNTRMKIESYETSIYPAIIEMANEIISDWDIATRIKNTWHIPSTNRLQ